MPKYSTTAVIMAAGSSKRFGENKLLADLAGKPLIINTLEAFEKSEFVKSVIVVTSEVMKPFVKKITTDYKILKLSDIIIGGKERQDSVFNALDYIKSNKYECSYIVIHDGARPLIDFKDIDKCVQGAVKSRAVTMAVRPKDTIKQSESAFSKVIHKTIPRETLWLIQTPQAFEFDLLYEAHLVAAKDNNLYTDDCAMVESIGVKPSVIEGDYSNIKITTPEDIIIANVLINHK